MSKLGLIQTNFTSGEISPAMYGRVDVAKYANGAKTLENMIPRPQGGVYRRPGTKFCGYMGENNNGLPTNSGACIIIPFSFNTKQSYILEISSALSPGNSTLSIWKDGVYQNTSYTFTGSGTKLAIPVPWHGIDLSKITWAQSADTLWICHPYYQPMVITRDASEIFSCTAYSFVDGPYKSQDQPDTVYLSNYVHTGTLKVQTGAFNFVAGDVNKYIEFKQDGTWKLAKIATIVSGTEVTVTLLDNLLTDLDASVRMDYWFKRKSTSPDIFDDPSPWHPVKPGFHTSYAAGNMTSTAGSAVFKRSDRGKYARDTGGVNEGQWVLLTGFTSSVSMTATSLTMKTGATGYPTDTLILVNEVRTIRATVKTGGTDGLGTDYWRTPDPNTGINGSGDSDTAAIGRHVRFNFSSFTTWGKISGVLPSGSTKSVDITLYENPPVDFNDGRGLALDGIPTSWRLGAWCGNYGASSYSGNFFGVGWPRIVTFHEQRLCFAASYAEPQTVWMSRPNDYGNFSPTELDSQVNDDNAISYTLLSRQVNEIKWLTSGPVLLIGTSGGEWQTKAASNIAAPLTPNNISVTPQGTVGSIATVPGTRVNAAVLHINRAGRGVRHLQYNFELDQFISKDLNILSEHILREGGTYAVRAEYQQLPHSLYWVVLADGRFACLTYEPDQEVYAWSKHRLGGGGLVKGIAVIPNTAGTLDQVYLIVQRVIGGTTYQYLERLNDLMDPTSSADITAQAFLDSSVTYSGISTTTITGLSHLNGETVRILGDGVDLGTTVVSSGQITCPSAVTHARVGYCQAAVLETLRPEAPGPQGTSQGKMKRIHKLQIRLNNSRSFTIGGDSLNSQAIDPSIRATGLETPSTNLFSGDTPVFLDQPWTTDGYVRLEQSGPYNLEVTSIMPEVTVTE